MEYSATAKYIRISTRKVRLVADSIRTLSPAVALRQLEMTPKVAAKPILKLLQSVLANAKTKSGTTDGLKFKTIEVMGGPVLKRWQAVSRGTAHSIKKRTSHIRIVLTDEKVENKSTKMSLRSADRRRSPASPAGRNPVGIATSRKAGLAMTGKKQK